MNRNAFKIYPINEYLYNLRNYLTPLWLIHKISLVVQSAVFDEGSDNINTTELSCYKIWRIKDDESLV